jgi:dephospho-CoA kinase
MTLEEKVKYADYVINNDNGLIELNREIDSVVAKLKQL